MMMLKMMNPFGSPSIPGVGGDDDKKDDGMTKEEAEEQERLRKQAIMQAEKERTKKYKKQEEERENVRQNIRDKVSESHYFKVLLTDFCAYFSESGGTVWDFYFLGLQLRKKACIIVSTTCICSTSSDVKLYATYYNQ